MKWFFSSQAAIRGVAVFSGRGVPKRQSGDEAFTLDTHC